MPWPSTPNLRPIGFPVPWVHAMLPSMEDPPRSRRAAVGDFVLMVEVALVGASVTITFATLLFGWMDQ